MYAARARKKAAARVSGKLIECVELGVDFGFNVRLGEFENSKP
jgi:hypothetical protein